MSSPFQAEFPLEADRHPGTAMRESVSKERNRVMTTVKRSFLALLIAPAAFGVTMAGSASAARAHQPTTVRAILQGHTVQVSGRNFAPGTRVAIALLDTRTLRSAITGSVMTEPATYQCRTGSSVMCCRKGSSLRHAHRF